MEKLQGGAELHELLETFRAQRQREKEHKKDTRPETLTETDKENEKQRDTQKRGKMGVAQGLLEGLHAAGTEKGVVVSHSTRTLDRLQAMCSQVMKIKRILW